MTCFVKNCISKEQTFSPFISDPINVQNWIDALPKRERDFDPLVDQVCRLHFPRYMLEQKKFVRMTSGAATFVPVNENYSWSLLSGAYPLIFCEEKFKEDIDAVLNGQNEAFDESDSNHHIEFKYEPYDYNYAFDNVDSDQVQGFGPSAPDRDLYDDNTNASQLKMHIITQDDTDDELTILNTSSPFAPKPIMFKSEKIDLMYESQDQLPHQPSPMSPFAIRVTSDSSSTISTSTSDIIRQRKQSFVEKDSSRKSPVKCKRPRSNSQSVITRSSTCKSLRNREIRLVSDSFSESSSSISVPKQGKKSKSNKTEMSKVAASSQLTPSETIKLSSVNKRAATEPSSSTSSVMNKRTKKAVTFAQAPAKKTKVVVATNPERHTRDQCTSPEPPAPAPEIIDSVSARKVTRVDASTSPIRTFEATPSMATSISVSLFPKNSVISSNSGFDNRRSLPVTDPMPVPSVQNILDVNKTRTTKSTISSTSPGNQTFYILPMNIATSSSSPAPILRVAPTRNEIESGNGVVMVQRSGTPVKEISGPVIIDVASIQKQSGSAQAAMSRAPDSFQKSVMISSSIQKQVALAEKLPPKIPQSSNDGETVVIDLVSDDEPDEQKQQIRHSSTLENPSAVIDPEVISSYSENDNAHNEVNSDSELKFDTLNKIKCSIKLPQGCTSTWTTRYSSKERCIIFSELSGQSKNDPVIMKSVLKIKENLHFEILVKGINVTRNFNTADEQIKSIHALQELISAISDIDVCEGFTGFDDFPSEHIGSLGSKVGQVWFSKSCLKVLRNRDIICFQCKRFQNTLSAVQRTMPDRSRSLSPLDFDVEVNDSNNTVGETGVTRDTGES